GGGGHNGNHGTAVFPDAMRWLWKDWPQPVKAGQSKNSTLEAILVASEGWQLVGEGYRNAEGPAANAKGEVFFNDAPNNRTYKVGLDGIVSPILTDAKKGGSQAFGPDGRLYALAEDGEKIIAYDNDRKTRVIAAGLRGKALVVASNGNIYITAA